MKFLKIGHIVHCKSSDPAHKVNRHILQTFLKPSNTTISIIADR